MALEFPTFALYSILAVASALFLRLLLVGTQKNTRRKPRQYPGPPKLPLIGNAHQVSRANLEEKLDEWSKKYGEIFVSTFLGRTVYTISNPELGRKVLSLRPGTFRRPERFKTWLDEMGFVGLFTAEGPTWGRWRRKTAPAFNHRAVRAMGPALARCARAAHCHLLRRHTTHTPSSPPRGGAAAAAGAVDCYELTCLFTLSVIARCGFGLDLRAYGAGCEQLEDLRYLTGMIETRVRSLAGRALPVPPRRWPLLGRLLPRERKLRFHSRRFDAFLRGLIEEQRRLLRGGGGEGTAAAAQRDTLLAQLMGDEAEGDDAGLTATELAGNMQTFFLAGMETTGATLAFALWELARRPALQEELHKEAVRALGPVAPGEAAAAAAAAGDGDDGEEGEGGWLARWAAAAQDSAAALPKAWAVFHEALRLHGPVTWLMHQAIKDVELPGGHFFPEGSMVAVYLRKMDLDPDRWHDPQTFKPERWARGPTDGEGKAAAATAWPAGWGVGQFGGGARACPGRGLALAEAPLFLAALCRGHRLALEEGHPPVHRLLRLGAVPNPPIRVCFTPR